MSARTSLAVLALSCFLVSGAVLGLLFDSFNNKYGLVYSTANFQLSTGSSHYTNISLDTGAVIFDLDRASDYGENFTLPSPYTSVAYYNLGGGIAVAALSVACFFSAMMLLAYGSNPDIRCVSVDQPNGSGWVTFLALYTTLLVVQACVSFPII